MECKYPEFGDYLRTLRKKAGKTQRAIAELAPVSPGRIGQLEQGAGLPRISNVARLARAYEGEEREMMDQLIAATLRAPDEGTLEYVSRLAYLVFPALDARPTRGHLAPLTAVS